MTDRGRAGSASWTAGRKRTEFLIAFSRRAAPRPKAHTHWTLQLLAEVVELEFAESISLETVRQLLKKTNSSPRRKSGVSPR